jgi:hypothetical protein
MTLSVSDHIAKEIAVANPAGDLMKEIDLLKGRVTLPSSSDAFASAVRSKAGQRSRRLSPDRDSGM